MRLRAPFVDAASSIDRTAWSNTFISYYTYGAAIAFGLDLEMRARSNGATTADDFMRALVRLRNSQPLQPHPHAPRRGHTLPCVRSLHNT